jgi:hypothetical protein
MIIKIWEEKVVFELNVICHQKYFMEVYNVLGLLGLIQLNFYYNKFFKNIMPILKVPSIA